MAYSLSASSVKCGVVHFLSPVNLWLHCHITLRYLSLECHTNYAALWLRNYIDSRGIFFKHPKFKSEEEYRIIIEIKEERIPRKEGDADKYVGEHNKKMIEGFTTKEV